MVRVVASLLFSLFVCLLAEDASFGMSTAKDGKDIELYRQYYDGGITGGTGGTTITHESAGGTVMDAFHEFLMGILLVVIAFPILYYNEKRQVHMDLIFSYSEGVIIDVQADKVDPSNQACPVCVHGSTSTDETLKDSQLGVTVTNCAKLSRSVEMYQWKENSKSEKRDTSGGGQDTITTYSYSQEWSSTELSNFSGPEAGNYRNPPMPIKGESWTAKNVAFGAFKLDENLIAQIGPTGPADIAEQRVGGKQCVSAGVGCIQSGGGSPEIGDLKIQMSKAECGTTSVASIQSGDSFQPLTYALVPKSSCCGKGPPRAVDLKTAQLNPSGGDVEVAGLCSCVGALIESGECMHNLYQKNLSGKGVIASMRSNQKAIHLILKILGWVCFAIGYYWIFKFPNSVFRFLPFIGTWIQYFANWFAYIAAFCFATFSWTITIAISWLAVKPVRGIILIIVAVSMIAVPTILSEMMNK